MLAIVLKVLSILGIVLLAVLAVMLLGLALVLFFPFTYRLSGSKDAEGLRLSVKVNWLCGLLRVRFRYPAPGRLTAKALWFSLLDMKIPPEKTVQEETDSGPADAGSPSRKKASRKADSSKPSEPEAVEPAEPEAIDSEAVPNAAKAANGPNTEGSPETGSEANPAAGSGGEGEGQTAQEGGPFGKISQKVQGIKYTIYNICDKIKGIWKNISYYMELLQEEETRQFFSHIRLRAGMILKSMRPRHIRADILFGTGSPDTTGYLYGVYCMLSPVPKVGVSVVPDFEKAVLEADFDISGHITIWVLAVNTCRIALDKRLRRLIRRAVSPAKKAAHKKAA